MVEVLYLVRHGKAEEHHPDGDRFRPLSPEGRLRIEQMLPRAKSQGFAANLALSSPYLRAVQTRDLFAPVFSPSRLETSKALTPSADPGEALDELLAWEAEGFTRIAVFTHNPFVTILADLLLRPGSAFQSGELVFHTPTLLALAFDRGLTVRSGRPQWILHP